MDGAGGGVAAVQTAGDPPRLSSSVPHSAMSSVQSSGPTPADPAALPAHGPQSPVSAELDKRRQKAKAKKQRQKDNRKAAAGQRTDEAKSERQDDASEVSSLRLDNKSLRCHLAMMREVMEELADWPDDGMDEERRAWGDDYEEE